MRVEESLMSIVFGFKHECFPNLVEVGDGRESGVEVLGLKGFSEKGADDVDHGVICRLSGGRSPLSWVSDDTESRFIGHNVDVFNVTDAVVGSELRIKDHFL
jgi:hypothetical protein